MDITRRHFFSRTSTGIGIAALGSLLTQDGFGAEAGATGGMPGLPHFAPRRSACVSCTSRAPSQMDLLDTNRRSTNSPGSTPRQRADGAAPSPVDIGTDQLFRWRGRFFPSSRHGQSARPG